MPLVCQLCFLALTALSPLFLKLTCIYSPSKPLLTSSWIYPIICSTPSSSSSPYIKCLNLSFLFFSTLLACAFALFLRSALMRLYSSSSACFIGMLDRLNGTWEVGLLLWTGVLLLWTSRKVVVTSVIGAIFSSALTDGSILGRDELSKLSWPAFESRLGPFFVLLTCELLIIIYYNSMRTLLILTSLLVTIYAQCHSSCLLCLSPPVCSLCLPAYALTIVG